MFDASMGEDMTTALGLAAPAPRLARPSGLRLAPAAPGMWRVLRSDGLIVGHLQACDDARGTRYRARRYRLDRQVFVDVGEFWSADDAVDALRYTR